MHTGIRPRAPGHQEAGHTVPALTNRHKHVHSVADVLVVISQSYQQLRWLVTRYQCTSVCVIKTHYSLSSKHPSNRISEFCHFDNGGRHRPESRAIELVQWEKVASVPSSSTTAVYEPNGLDPQTDTQSIGM